MPGDFLEFNGLWSRGHIDKCPPNHFPDCSNLVFHKGGFSARDGYTQFHAQSGVVRMHLYKPNPPFSGTNIPRPIVLTSAGVLKDLLLGTTLHTDADWVDFALVNFFGRCYISPHDGKVGLQSEVLYVYDGTTFREAGGDRPVAAPTVAANTSGVIGVGTVVFSYAFETESGFITKPAPFAYQDSFGFATINITGIPVGPAGTVARHIIASRVVENFGIGTYRNLLGDPFDVSDESIETLPLFIVDRIGDNVTTTYAMSFYDENLRESADFLFTQRENIPAGVGLMDFQGRLVTYGTYDDPSLVLVSEPGEPESHNETSGFFITDPTDSTGVRCGTEFRETLYVYKKDRGYMCQDNGDEPSTWRVLNFEKSRGTEQYGIANILDAKGASSEGYLMATRAGIYFFNGIFIEPELTYKIRDYWNRINENFFHKIQLSIDPHNKRIYCLIPLDDSEEVSHIIYGDYSEGLTPQAIKWCPWELTHDPTSLLIYTDFTDDEPSLVTRISNANKIVTLLIDTPASDDGTSPTYMAKFAPVRYGVGLSQFTRLRFRSPGPALYTFTLYGMDELLSSSIGVVSAITLGQEYARKINFVNEHGILHLTTQSAGFKMNAIILEGGPLWEERPQ